MSKRNLTPYEANQLLRHGFSLSEIDKHGNKPVEYVTGFAEFMERDFEVSPDTLIPRLETEELVNYAINYSLRQFRPDQSLVIADVGCGSGCIGITTFLELLPLRPRIQVYVSDISTSALEITRHNVNRLVLPENQPQFKLVQSDLLLDYPDLSQIHIIVANLPYIPSQRITHLDDSVKEFEPHSALDGGTNKGLNYVNQLVNQAETLVYQPELIIQEIDEFVRLKDLYRSNLYTPKLKTDTFGKVRFAIWNKTTT